jgi:uncharacterized BrkB/YihY/UPF0761 family membrane protein
MATTPVSNGWLLWLWLSAIALLFGAELNGELEREKAERDRAPQVNRLAGPQLRAVR